MITALPHYLGKLPLIWLDAVLLCCGSGWLQYCRSMAHDEPMKCRPGSPGAPPLSPAQILRTCSHFRTPKPLSSNLKEDLGKKAHIWNLHVFHILFHCLRLEHDLANSWLIFPTSSPLNKHGESEPPHHVVELIACPRRPADSTFQACCDASEGDQWIPMLLVGGGQISWCNHVKVLRNHSVSQTAKNFHFNMFWGSWLLTLACHLFRRWPSQSNIVWWRSHKTVWLKWGRMHPAKG